MANVDSIVTINIVVQDSAVSEPGFGIPMVMTHESPFGPELVRSYSATADMVADGFSATGATVAAVTAILAQNPKVVEVKVGRRTSTATAQTRVMTVATALDNTDYTVTINGVAFTFDSGVAPTPITIALGLDALINAGGEPVSSTDNLDGTFDLIADVVGDLFGLTHSVSIITQDDTSLEDGIAADYAAIKLEDDDFYGVTMTSGATLEAEALAAVVEADRKIFGFNSADSDILSNTAGNLFETLATAAYNRTLVIFSQDNFDYAAAAWIGNRFPIDPGSSTWAFKTLAGVSVDPLNNTQINNIETNDGNHYTATAGVNITLQGTMASGRFIDITRGIDWLHARLQTRLFGVFVNTPKVPYTNSGVTLMESEVNAQMLESINRDVLAANPAPTVTVPDVLDSSQVSANDKATRTLPAVEFSGTLSGAIHNMTVNGSVSP